MIVGNDVAARSGSSTVSEESSDLRVESQRRSLPTPSWADAKRALVDRLSSSDKQLRCVKAESVDLVERLREQLKEHELSAISARRAAEERGHANNQLRESAAAAAEIHARKIDEAKREAQRTLERSQDEAQRRFADVERRCAPFGQATTRH